MRLSLPRLRGLPLLGNLLELRRDAVTFLERAGQRLGDIGLFHVGRRPVVLITAPALARTVLVDDADAFEKGPAVRRFAGPLLGDGLISCATDDHPGRRQQIAPLLGPARMARLLPIVDAELARARSWFVAGATVDVGALLRRLTLAIIGKLLFSVDLLEVGQDVARAVTAMNEQVARRIRSPLAALWPFDREARRATAAMDAVVARLVRRRREPGSEQDDLLAALLTLPVDDRRIRDELMTLLSAGHETSASALTWTLFLLARHPSVAARVRDELDRFAGGALSVETLDRLVYTEQVLKEAMRLYPPVHTLGRQARRPVRVGDCLLPPGTIVAVSPYLMHRRADLFPSPREFVPDRFHPGAAPVAKHAYLPFGAGPRVCAGAWLAMLEMKACLAGLLARLPLELEGDPPRPEMLVTLVPRRPLLARVRVGAHG